MPGQGMQQVQTLRLQQTLAPQLQQSLQILQLPTLELRALIQQEMERNPVLEDQDGPGEADPATGEEPGAQDGFAEEFERLARLDDDWRDSMARENSQRSWGAEEQERRQFFFESIPVEETLQQHLVEQLKFVELAPEARRIAELIIGNIDDRGYLTAALADMASNTGVSEGDLEEVLRVVQGFHPPGIGARDLRECLLLQLERQGKGGGLEYRLVDRHLDALGKHRYPEIARRLGLTVEKVQGAARTIATLDPRPGQRFAPDPGRYVLPDVSVERVGDDYTVTLNGEQIPHLRISAAYRELMASDRQGSDVREYIREKIRSGKLLIKGIHQRQETIRNIANEIVRRQRDFFEHGPAHLRPLTMAQVAERVGVHETTVSRAISGKYISTPHGVFEMKYFFTPGFSTAGGESMSNTSVKRALEELVRGEDARQPLSDQEIVRLLGERGIPIARRTVAKYRGELGILPSNMRRRY